MNDHIAKQTKPDKTPTIHVAQRQEEEQLISGNSPDTIALQRAIESPSADSLTPSVVSTLQRQYGNHFVNNLIQQSRLDTINRAPADEDDAGADADEAGLSGKAKKAYKALKKAGLRGAAIKKLAKVPAKKRVDAINTDYKAIISAAGLKDDDLTAVFAEFGIPVAFKGGQANAPGTKKMA